MNDSPWKMFFNVAGGMIGLFVLIALIVLVRDYRPQNHQPSDSPQSAAHIRALESEVSNLSGQNMRLRIDLIEERGKRVETMNDWFVENAAKLKCQDELGELKK